MKNYILFNAGPFLGVVDTKHEPGGVERAMEQEGQWVETDEVPANLHELTIIDGHLVPAPSGLLAERARLQAEAEMWAEKERLLRELKNTDYKAIKFAEGEMSSEDYAPTRLARAAARERINEIEESLTKKNK